jgi:serine/threonine protein phosphatase PrpC
MRRLASAHDNAFEARLRAGEQDRQRAAMAAADEVRPARWAHLMGKSFGHFSGSITACCSSDSNSVAIAQVGAGRAYRCRAGKLELLVLDHMLSTLVAAHANMAGDPDPHPGVVTSLLGGSNELRLDEATVSVEAGDAIILCSHSVWSRSGELVADLCRRRVGDVADVERLVAERAVREKHDATMVVIRFS